MVRPLGELIGGAAPYFRGIFSISCIYLSSQGWNGCNIFFGFSVMVSPRPRPQNHGRDEGPWKCLRTLPQCSWAMAWSLAPVWMLQNSKCLVGRPTW